MIDNIKTLSQNQFDEIVDIRRFFHQNPELSFNEHNTAKRIAQELDRIGIPYTAGVGGTGVVAIIQGSSIGPTVGLRAELDALPIQEETGLSFSSKNSNIMHACGHDVHAANLIGTAKILWAMRHDIKGKVMLIFQPGEELLPGGAVSIIDSEIFKKNKPDFMLGLHILPEMLAGKVGFKSGPYMASGDEVYITVKGKGGHAALPHTLIDPIVIASQIIVALQQIVSRFCPSATPTVLSFGRIEGNGANNIIPDEVRIEGTFRTMDEKWRTNAHRKIEDVANGIASSLGGNCIVDIRKGYPSLANNPELTQFAIQMATEYLGVENVDELPTRMTTDDFAHYAQIVPSVYFRVGSGFPTMEPYSLHSSCLNVNEYVLQHSPGLLAWIVVRMLSHFQ